MQRRPPWNGTAARPVFEYRYRPTLLLITLTVLTVKPELADALDVPLAPIDGVQPSEFTFAVQYTCGPATRSTMAARRSSPAQMRIMRSPGARGGAMCGSGAKVKPHTRKPPSLVRPTLRSMLASSSTKTTPGGNAGMLHC